MFDPNSLAVAGVGSAFGLILLRRHFKGGQFRERVSAKGKVAVVTGSNTGIGLETVRELNLRGAKVYLLCRSEQRANEGIVKLVKMGCDATRLIYVNCDLSSFDNVRKSAAKLAQLESHIDILVNNAGLWLSDFEKTMDGHETTWQTNHLGPFLLTELLLPLVEKAEEGRIVNVASALHRKSPVIDLSSIDSKDGFGSAYIAYNKTKLANVMHARELSRRLRAKGNNVVTVNSLHPGVIASELWRNFGAGFKVAQFFAGFMLKTERDGAQTSLYLALSKDLKGVSGFYFQDCARNPESPQATDDLACKQLYDYSRKAVGLD
ncbi:hypothetical protein PFISCL1PPCAC_9082 [Pristionchus fissidentatus]|uniref:Dehydrogenase n=1 Tax=Pristionchus fissidentatus TaxID=1538716 RepID=A0AAV5VGS1_9BILA|nr:hypothetical protein PFISCL1PPCAC_9082 [Pristionchus fissidentatus]